MQTKKAQQKIVAPKKVAVKPADYEEENTTSNHRARRRSRVMSQKRKSNDEALDCITFFAANETADIPALTIISVRKRRLGGANMYLQLDEWTYDEYFSNAIIDEETGNR